MLDNWLYLHIAKCISLNVFWCISNMFLSYFGNCDANFHPQCPNVCRVWRPPPWNRPGPPKKFLPPSVSIKHRSSFDKISVFPARGVYREPKLGGGQFSIKKNWNVFYTVIPKDKKIVHSSPSFWKFRILHWQDFFIPGHGRMQRSGRRGGWWNLNPRAN